MQQQGAAAVELTAVLGPRGEGRTHGPIDRLPTETGQPGQGGAEPFGQQGRRWRHIRHDQHRLGMGPQPGQLLIQLGWQVLFQLLQGPQRGLGIGAEGIGLEHTHIPAARPPLVGHRPHGQPQEGIRQGRG